MTERLAELRSTERGLESSETEFIRRFAEFAAEGQLYPQREGSPLMEFAAGGRVLYLFDRTGPYTAHPGAARVIVNGIVDPQSIEEIREPDPEEQLTVLGVSAVEAVGRILHVSRRSWIVQARLPLVLSGFEALPDLLPGDWVAFRTLPPLHGFLVGL